ncbi:MAG: hypothetical protein RJA22_1628 [Verrucomicrobiota bacterium]
MSARPLCASACAPAARRLRWPLRVGLFLVLLAGLAQPALARLVCARVLLPSPEQQAAAAICLEVLDGRPGGFLQVDLSGVPAGFTLSNRTYRGWAVAYPGTPAAGRQCPVRAYNSLEALPAGLPEGSWDLVGYLINHPRGTADEMQGAIWALLGVTVPPDDPRFSPPSETTQELIAEARSVGPGFVPQSGQVAGILVVPPPGAAPVLVEVATVPDRMPTAGPDAFSTAQPTPLVLTPAQLLANDSDADGDVVSLVDVRTNSARGGLVTFDGQRIIYLPPAGYVGPDSFSYGLYAGPCGQAIGTVTVDVQPRPNRAPVAVDDLLTGEEDGTLLIPGGLLLANDSDPDGDPLQIISAGPASERGGAIRFDGTNVVYTPPPNYSGPDTFTYTVSDGRGGTATATVTVLVRAVNDPPVAGDLEFATPINTPLLLEEGRFLGAVVDPEGDAVTLVGVSPASSAGGTVRLVDKGVVYTPRPDFIGTDIFQYIVQDASGARATGRVSVVVMPAPIGIGTDPLTLNFQTGLFEQRVSITNEGTMALAAFRLDVLNVPAGVVVWNASGTNDGVPFIQYNRSLEAGARVSIRVEYYIPDRRPFATSYRVVPTPAAAPKPPMDGIGVVIERTLLDTRIPGEPRYLIEFASVPGRVYTIVYSDDMKSWKTAVPAVTASSNRTQWYDDGPPKTDSRPSEQVKRFYRVVENP